MTTPYPPGGPCPPSTPPPEPPPDPCDALDRLDFDFPFPPRRRRRPADHAPFLVLRYTQGDDGQRPMPANIAWWGSPDILIVGPTGIPNLAPVPGEPHRIEVRVYNLGRRDAAPVRVRFWAFHSLLGGEAGAQFIGEAFAFVPGRGSRIVPCPADWMPTGDLSSVLIDASTEFDDPITATFDPFADRHVSIAGSFVAAPMAAEEEFMFVLPAGNIAAVPQAASVGVRVLAEGGETAADAAIRLPVTLEVGAEPRFVASSSTLFARRLAMMGGAAGAADPSPPGGRHEIVAHEAGEVRDVTIRGRLPAHVRPGERFTIEIVQHLGPVVTGAVRLRLTVAPEACGSRS